MLTVREYSLLFWHLSIKSAFLSGHTFLRSLTLFIPLDYTGWKYDFLFVSWPRKTFPTRVISACYRHPRSPCCSPVSALFLYFPASALASPLTVLESESSIFSKRLTVWTLNPSLWHFFEGCRTFMSCSLAHRSKSSKVSLWKLFLLLAVVLHS